MTHHLFCYIQNHCLSYIRLSLALFLSYAFSSTWLYFIHIETMIVYKIFYEFFMAIIIYSAFLSI